MRITPTLLILSLFIISANSTVSVVTVTNGIKILFSVVEDVWKIVDDHSNNDGPFPFRANNKQHLLLEKVDQLADSIQNVRDAVEVTQAGIVSKILNGLNKIIKIELRMNDLIQNIGKIDAIYQHMTTYAKHKREIENSTLIDFAEAVLSHDANSVRFLLDRVHHFINSEEQHNSMVHLMSDKVFEVM